MSREAHIPIALWISAAIVVHLAGGGGAVEVAEVVEERAQFRAMVNAVREGLRSDTTFEILTGDVMPTPPLEAPKPPVDPPESDDPAVDSDAKDPNAVEPPKVKPKPKKPKPRVALVKPAELPKPLAEKPKEPPPRAETPSAPPPPPVVAKVEPVKPAEPPPLPPGEKRLAVRQHVEKDQKDNPDAKRIADDANRTDEESVARVRVHDHDDPDPTAGSGVGPKDKPGNNDHDKVADSEDKKGNPDNAPGEAQPSSTSVEHHRPAAAAPPSVAAAKGPPATSPGARGGGAGAAQARAASEASPGSAGGSGPASPEVSGSDSGTWRIDPANPGGDGKSRVAGARRAPTPYRPPVSVGNMGFGAPGIPGGPNPNLTPGAFEAAVGQDQLKRERAADGEARRTAHRGSGDSGKWERMKGAIENYEPSVKLGNQTSLNAARVPFASYINAIHNRIHPIFAEEFLAALDNVRPEHPMNSDLVTHVEIVLSKDEGRIVRLGVTRASGNTAFDTVALSSVQRASPFGKAPDIIVSPDGNVYLHWEFHRDPYDACTTRNARPFILKSPPPLKTPTPKRPLPQTPSDDRRAPPPLVPLRRP